VFVDEQRFLWIHFPIGKLALELFAGLPQRVSHLFRRPLESVPGELEHR
jgi:hypothetical protein